MTGIGSLVVQGVLLHVFRNVFIKWASSGSLWAWLEIVVWLSEDSVLAMSWLDWCRLSLFSASGWMFSRLVCVLESIPCAENSQCCVVEIFGSLRPKHCMCTAAPCLFLFWLKTKLNRFLMTKVLPNQY